MSERLIKYVPLIDNKKYLMRWVSTSYLNYEEILLARVMYPSLTLYIDSTLQGAFCDLVWSDPEERLTSTPWQVSPRGAGYLFGARVTDEFAHVNNLELIARAHQLVMEGKQYHFPNKNLVTVWSAPNYCYRCGNVAAILTIGNDGKEMKENEIVEVEGGEEEDGDGKEGVRRVGGSIRQSFKFFRETEQSVHGPKGEERAQLVPYFL